MSSNENDFGLTLDRNQSQASTHKLFAMHVCIPTLIRINVMLMWTLSGLWLGMQPELHHLHLPTALYFTNNIMKNSFQLKSNAMALAMNYLVLIEIKDFHRSKHVFRSSKLFLKIAFLSWWAFFMTNSVKLFSIAWPTESFCKIF